MHEYGVAQEVFAAAMHAAAGRPITRLRIRLGALSGVVDQSLLMYLDLIAEEQLGATVPVAVTLESARFRCECGREYESDDPFAECPQCSTLNRSVIGGMQCMLESIDVEEAPTGGLDPSSDKGAL